MVYSDFTTVLPEVLLALYAMAALLFAVYTSKDALTPVITWAVSTTIGQVASDRSAAIAVGRPQRSSLRCLPHCCRSFERRTSSPPTSIRVLPT